MKIEDFLNSDDNMGMKRYYEFETFIISLLKHHAVKQNKELIQISETDGFGDAYLSNGINDIEGPTLIEIKYDVNNINNNFINRMNTTDDRLIDKYRNLLIVTAIEMNSRTKSRLSNIMTNSKIIIWGPTELNNIISQYSDFSNDLMNNIFKLRLESALTKPSSDWKTERQKIIKSITELYNKGQFSLFLGAGVSSSAGMPDWNTLLNSLFVNYITKEMGDVAHLSDNEINEIVHRLNAIDSQSALMAARYIRKGMSSNNIEAFNKEVTELLYRLRNKKILNDSKLIKTICHMCTPRRTGAKVRSIVTYNFDDLLERQLNQTHNGNKSIFCENDLFDLEQLPIYHVHGFLPEKYKDYPNLDKSTFVFSEEGYHKIYSEPYHWSNLVQLNALRENTCLMIGLSMTDPNLRRLLDIAARNLEKPRHFAFMKRVTIDQFTIEGGKEVISNRIEAEKFLTKHFKLHEELMKELGVTIVWYETYDEIPVILEQVMEFGK